MDGGPRGGFEHDVLVYDGLHSFLVETVPFVTAGLDAGDPVMVAVGPEPARALQGALGSGADQVRFVDMHAVGRNPARIIPVWQSFVRESEGRPARGIGEPVWPGRTSAEIVECQHHEALLDLAFAAGPAWRLLCPYDAGGLAPDVVERARSHHHEPVLPDAPLPDAGESALTPAPPEALVADFGTDLGPLRDRTRAWASARGLPSMRVDDLVLTVDELAANSVLHGGGCGRLRLWADNSNVIAEVSDHGQIQDPMVGRRRPRLDALSGRGLWIANMMCDLVQIRSSGSGTVVRAHLDTHPA